MKELTALMLTIIVITFTFLIGSFLVEFGFLMVKVFRKTIHKKKYKEKLTNRVNECIKYNKERTRFYKGEVKEEYKPSESGISTSISEEYLREYGIDQYLIDEMIESYNLALKYCDIYYEKLKQENIESRLKFIEKELKDIKRKQGYK